MINNLIKKLCFVVFMLATLNSISQEQPFLDYNLMPWPKEVNKKNTKLKINESFTVAINKKEGRAYKHATNFIRRIADRTGVFIDKGFPLVGEENATVNITFSEVAALKLKVNESYELTVNDKNIEIKATTDVGVLRALETVLQLVSHNKAGFYIQGVNVNDAPRFVWRGLMIDAARHFQPVNVIKRNLRAMASVKMNVFHWHLSDDQGYRVESKVYPKLHQVASDGLYYTHNQIKDVVAYANELGIRVVPEIDVPGHATAILAAYPELGSKDGATYKVERFAGIFNPTLNPIKPEVYVFLDNLFGEIAPLFPDAYFHIGGDENAGKHWDANPKIQQFKKENNLVTNHDLQTYFNIKLQVILKKYGKKLMGWDEIMTKDMPKTAIIHSWRGKHEGFKKGTLIEAVKSGYQSVLSNDYYIDRLESVNHHYLFDPAGDEKLSAAEEERVLGGEVTMWSELVTPLTIDSRIWPRTAAIAERFWSAKEVKDLVNMRKRLAVVNTNLEELGIQHISNKYVILRNIAKTNNVAPIDVLTKIFEPLKIYTRNKGGTEYKSFSPFTLFADACSADAVDAYNFKQSVASFVAKPTAENKKEIKHFFNKWMAGYAEFTKMTLNPNTKVLQAHYKALNTLSTLCLAVLESNDVATKKSTQIKECVALLKEPMVDTELVILSSIEQLLQSCKKK